MRLFDFNLSRDWFGTRRRLAQLFGYFWSPCPCCGRFFAGFEAGRRDITDDGERHLCVCRWCDTCAGALREQHELAELIRFDPSAGVGFISLCGEPTPETWRCRE